MPEDPKKRLRTRSDSLTMANKDLPWIKRYLEGNQLSIPDPYNPGSGKTSSHGLSYHPLSDSTAMIYPEIIQQGDSLVHRSGDTAREYATQNDLGINTDLELAKYYSQDGLIDHTKYAQGGNIMAKKKQVKRLTPKKTVIYADGGWLKENAGTIGGIVGGGLGMIGGPGLSMALGAAGSAVGGMIEGEGGPEELAEDYMIPSSLSKQHYQRAAGGGDLTEYVGPRHEEGGIQLGGLPVEVEGGETRTNNMMHSDRHKITKADIKMYPVLKKSDKGKTMAQITKREHKKFEKRKWDELNDNAAEIAMMPFEQISDDLAPEMGTVAAQGGDITALKAREILGHGQIRGRAITDKQRRFFGAKSKMEDGGDMSAIGKYAPLITSGMDMVGAMIGGPEEVDYGNVGFTPTKREYVSAEPGIQRIRRTFGNAESKLRKYNPGRYMARMGDLASRESDAVTGQSANIQAINAQTANRANLTDVSMANKANLFNKQIGIAEAEANAANRGVNKSRISGNLANIGTISGQMARDDRLFDAQENYNQQMFDYMREKDEYMYGNPETVSSGAYPQMAESDFMTNLPMEAFQIDGMPINVDPNLQTPPDSIPGYENVIQRNQFQLPQYRLASGGDLSHRLRLRPFKTI